MLAITNPASSLAVFLGMTPDKTLQEQRQIAITATITIVAVLILITWTGIPILESFGISLPAFEITGGIIILLRSLSMIHSKETPTSQTAAELQTGPERESIAIVPLAIPIIAGPGAMTTSIIYTQHFPGILNRIYISVGILIVSVVMGIVLFYANHISKFLGVTAIKIITRIMGLILAAIATSMITTGMKEIFPGFT